MKLYGSRQAAGEADRMGDRSPDSHALSGLLGRIWDSLAPGLADALADIRKKAVEEAWFGREVTDRELSVTHHGAPEVAQAAPLSFADLMRSQSLMLPEPELDESRDIHSGPDL